ncbi:MAG: magnesium transporter [Candidatus Caldatribacteriota bacterium]|nr:magnesium transporter [Atribacterota bacterium]MDD3640428.1 magnesium transporter [Atribacterota bacterium]MDD4288220.1 magnesium transporter [Atribacterota bacterium]MDD4764439.1 magnesium transporter [Atribacterota bacterium]MDI9596582.1 magnesium transporter [Atribacterota bacterium]
MDEKILIEKIKKLLDEKKLTELKEIVEDLHPNDFSDITEELTTEQIIEIFKQIEDKEKVAEYISELNTELQSELLNAMSKRQASEILEEMDTDEAVDILGEIPPEESRELLDLMPAEEAEEIKELMKYGENTSGSVMNNEFVTLFEYMTVEQAINRIREMSPEAEIIYYVYVLDKRDRLIGVLSLRDLIVADTKSKISAIMEEDVISVLDVEDREVAAKVISDYDFLAIPVINKKGMMVGIITVDDIIDVLEEEVTEDIHKMVGSAEFYEDKLIKATPLTRAKARLPWLLVCMVGEIISGSVIEFHSGILEVVVALAFFIPIIMAMGGNVGAQSSTITVRGLATGQLRLDELWKNIWTETKVGFFIGITIGVMISILTYFWQNDYILGLTIGLSLCVTVIAAATVGTFLPLVFTKLNIDPAVATGPFITTAVDVGSLIIYFSLGTYLFTHLGNI